MKRLSHPEVPYHFDDDDKIEIIAPQVKLEHILINWKGEADFDSLNGALVLDLASGSESSPYSWKPLFARMCVNHGAEVTALDICPQSENDAKYFQWAAVDLVAIVMTRQLHILQVLKGKKFDIINSANFVGFNSPPELFVTLRRYGITKEQFESMLLDQLQSLLANGGIISLDQQDERFLPIMHKKVGDELIQVSIY